MCGSRCGWLYGNVDVTSKFKHVCDLRFLCNIVVLRNVPPCILLDRRQNNGVTSQMTTTLIFASYMFTW